MFLTPKALQEARDLRLQPIYEEVCKEIEEMMLKSREYPDGAFRLTVTSKATPVRHRITNALTDKGWIVQWSEHQEEKGFYYTLLLKPKDGFRHGELASVTNSA